MGQFSVENSASPGQFSVEINTHLTRRPREDTFLPEQNSLNLGSALLTVHAA